MGMEPQSTLSGFLFKRTEQVVFLSDRKYSVRQKPTCPPSRSEDFPPKSENLTKGVKDNSNVEKQNNNPLYMVIYIPFNCFNQSFFK